MRRRRPAVLVSTLALMVLGAAVITNVVPYRQIIEQRRQVTAASQELAALRAENAMLAARRQSLETPVEIERLAREKLGYVRPGEIAYVVLEPPAMPVPTAPPAPEPTPAPDRPPWVVVWDFITGADLSGD
jgi:cell division protein FtsB